MAHTLEHSLLMCSHALHELGHPGNNMGSIKGSIRSSQFREL